ncbi:MAG: SAM-dependent methyltransferase [Chloroflexi bacterium]|nr:SAM-dependent methyltransferase [Chloroflexota bacterium]
MASAEEEVRLRIHRDGPITFREFMEVALYAPGVGYYASRGAESAQRDYFTAPSVHPLFGALVAHQLQQFWEALGRPEAFWVVEPGAGDGLLCRDILSWLSHLDTSMAHAVRYVVTDRGSGLRVEQELPADLLPRVHRIRTAGLPLGPITGCIISNELLDAFPVHRVTVQGGRLREIYVGLDAQGGLVERLGRPSTPALEKRFRELGISLPEGYRTEVNLELASWVREVASTLERGFVLTVDYGHPATDLYGPTRSRGTLRCYYRHTLNANPYQHVGRQDISVHVDFTTLIRLGEPAGLQTLGFATQGEFLENLGFRAYLASLAARRDLHPAVRRNNQMAMEELVKPDGMGAFRVLAQGKGVGAPALHGFSRDNPLCQRLEAESGTLPVPMATKHHLAGRLWHG